MNVTALIAALWIGGETCPGSDLIFDQEGMTLNIRNTLCLAWEDQSDMTYTIETKHGPIVVRHRIFDNPLPDTVEVLSTPDGFIAIPQHITVDERSTGQIHIREFMGF
jgi:hypothetical protein